jgi:tetratricopeptide (TPR) repeat protein
MRTCLPSKAWILIFFALLQGCGWNPFGAKDEYLRRGREFARQGKDDEAAFQYRKALQKDPKYGDAYLRYGQLLARENKTAEALNLLSRAVELSPKSDEAKIELGRTAVSALLGDPRHPPALHRIAAKIAADLLAANPNSVEGLRIMGYLAVADSQPKQAIDYFRKTLALNPNLPEVSTVLAQTLIFDNQGEEAEKVATHALATARNYGPLYDALYSYYRSSNRPSDGEKLLQSKIANNPKNTFFVIELAGHYQLQKNTPRMEEVLHGLAANSANYPYAPLEVGDFYRRMGNLDEAIRYYQTGLQSPRKKDCLQRIVSARLAQGRNTEAAAALETILKQYPDDATALASRADLRMATGKPEEMQKAVTELAGLVKKEPANTGLQYSLGRAYRQLGRESDAQSIFRDILQRDPKHHGALRELADLSIRDQKPDEALRYAERLIEIDPANTGARLVRTSAWALTGRFSEVRAELRRLTADNPNLTEPWLQMATLDVDTKNYTEAEQIFRRLYQQGKGDIRPAKGLVMLYLTQRQPQKALALARDEAARSSSPEARILLATTAAQTGDLDMALATASKLASDFPDNPDHLVFVGEMYRRTGRLEQAIASFQLAQTKAPANPVPGSHLAEALAQACRFDEAIQASRANLKMRPEDPLLLNALAWQLALANRNLDEAASLIKRALRQDPANTSFMDTSGMIDLKARKLDDALLVFQQLVRKDPNTAAYRIHLAQVLVERGELPKARKEFETALQSRPSDAEAEEIRKSLSGTLKNRL